ncbi:MAG TPA: alpha-glucan family phosphorylase [Cytophagaceae bacterium]|jgi:starch phosphorylase|nr:alpha-glucan family phosphorylase [Cytophagaceae bacterium]
MNQGEKENKYSTKVAYFCMEYAIDQSLKIYSGGLGFLSGSHLRSAYQLKQNLVAIGLLYSQGYYDQVRNTNEMAAVMFRKREYSFLQDTGILFTIHIHNAPVKVKVYFLPPEIFGTAPLYLLTSDIPENDFLARSICFRLYNHDLAAKVAQSILLGIGGAKFLETAGIKPDVYHLNEGHGLPLIFQLFQKYGNIENVRKHLVFTTHTPDKAGNDTISLALLNEMNFFDTLPLEKVKEITQTSNEELDFTLTALRFAKIANGVSKIHGQVANQMWANQEGVCPIISITNAQNALYWTDPLLKKYLSQEDETLLSERKKELKEELLKEVADQTGKLFDPEILTIVWARRVTAYKRIDLLLKDIQSFQELIERTDQPIQVIWAGKPYPEDYDAVNLFNNLITITQPFKRCAVLTGYELKLSALLKKGADVWLNTPHYGREASGTSGMTASMNGAINLSVADGWFPEFSKHGHNSFVIQPSMNVSVEQQDKEDNAQLIKILKEEVIPVYYNDKTKWNVIRKNAMKEIVPMFDSDRMAIEYYQKSYCI